MGLWGRIKESARNVFGTRTVKLEDVFGIQKVAFACSGECSVKTRISDTKFYGKIREGIGGRTKFKVSLRRDNDAYRIWEGANLSRLSETIKKLYRVVSSEEEVTGLKETLNALEQIKLADYEDRDERGDLITLESLIRARIRWETGKGLGFFDKYENGNKTRWAKVAQIDPLEFNKRKYNKFSDYVRGRIDYAKYWENKSPKTKIEGAHITEEGTFHVSSLARYGILSKKKELEPALV